MTSTETWRGIGPVCGAPMLGQANAAVIPLHSFEVAFVVNAALSLAGALVIAAFYPGTSSSRPCCTR